MTGLTTLADCGLNPVCHIAGALGGAAGSVATSAVDMLAEAVSEAVGDAIKSVATLWMKVGTPDIGDSVTGAPSDSVGFIQGALSSYVAAAAVLSVLVAAGRMAWDQHARHSRDLAKSLATLVVVSGAGVAIVTLGTQNADLFAKWIIDRSTQDTDFGKNLSLMLASGAAPGGALPALLVVVLGLMALLTSLLQIALMAMRGAMLVVLVGVLPLSAAAANTEVGRTWLHKSIGWTVAFILYKPAAAIVYATAFRLTGTDLSGDGAIQNFMAGLVCMALAILTLPALMRFCVPAVGALASGGGGTGSLLAAGAGVAAAAAMPSGAVAVNAARSGGGMAAGGGPTGAGPTPGPSGSGGSGGGGGGGEGGPSTPDAPTGSSGNETADRPAGSSQASQGPSSASPSPGEAPPATTATGPVARSTAPSSPRPGGHPTSAGGPAAAAASSLPTGPVSGAATAAGGPGLAARAAAGAQRRRAAALDNSPRVAPTAPASPTPPATARTSTARTAAVSAVPSAVGAAANPYSPEDS